MGVAKPFVMACRPGLFRSLQAVSGDQVRRLGPDLDYPGQVAIPAFLDPTEAALNLDTRVRSDHDAGSAATKLLQFMASGVSHRDLSSELGSVLQAYM